MQHSQPLWAAGPGELLQHGIGLLGEDNESNRRISMILIDNAVELIMKTYLTLPERVTGLSLPRKKRDEYCANFPSLLDGIETTASEKIIGLNLGEFEWFHRLRNQLYHDGNALTVEKKNVEVFAELAEKLFEALFDCKLRLRAPEGTNAKLIGEFFEEWISIERDLAHSVPSGKRITSFQAAQILHKQGEITNADLETFRQTQVIRNQLVHGEADPDEMLRPENMAKVKQVAKSFGEVVLRAIQSAAIL